MSSGGNIIPEIRFDNVGNFAADVFTALPKLTGNIWAQGYDAIKGPLSESVGIQSEKQRTEQERVDGLARESAARSSVYNDAISDRSVDATTRAEIESLYNSGASSATIAALYTKSQDGKGLYGVRRLNSNAATIQADQPGRAQLLGSSATLGSSGTTGGGNR